MSVHKCVSVHVFAICLWVPSEARGHWSPWSWSYISGVGCGQTWVLGSSSGPLENCWATFLAPCVHFRVLVSKVETITILDLVKLLWELSQAIWRILGTVFEVPVYREGSAREISSYSFSRQRNLLTQKQCKPGGLRKSSLGPYHPKCCFNTEGPFCC